MFTETPNAPAKLIKEFGAKMGKPALKSALIQECSYVGAQHLEDLVNIKSREELIGDIIGLLQSPARNVISALTASGGGKIAGLVKTLSEKE
jgi:large subunit ribosomal protein L10